MCTKKQKLKSCLYIVPLIAMGVGGVAVGEIRSPLLLDSWDLSKKKYDIVLSVEAETGLERSIATQDTKAGQKKKIARKSQKRAFSLFRPVDRDDIDLGEQSLESTKIEQIYNKDFRDRMRSRYNDTVAHWESKVNSPFEHAERYELESYNQSRKEMVNWTTKEILNTQVKEFLRGGDRNSGAMQVLGAVKSVTSGSEDEDEQESNEQSDKYSAERSAPKKVVSQEEKIARAHQLDDPTLQKEKPSIPTKLRAKLNVVRQRGQLNFQNPIVSTVLNLDLSGEEKVLVDMNKEFEDLALRSYASYGLDKKVFTMNLNKRITDEVALDLNTKRYLGSFRGESGERRSEAAKLIYSLSF